VALTTIESTSRLRRLLPPTRLGRLLALRSILYAFGLGAFMTGSAVFFTRIVGLSAGQVGLGLSLSGLVVVALSVPLGRLVDRLGALQMWGFGALTEAGLFALYPLVHGFTVFLLLLVGFAIVQTIGQAGRGAYTIAVFPREERVRTSAYMRSALNIGFTLGALTGGVALATDDNAVIRGLPWLCAAVLMLNAVLVVGLPRPETAPAVETATEAAVGSTALRNRGFLVLSITNGILSTNQVLLNIVVPLWLVERTDAPHVLLAWLFGTNTVLAVLFQVRAARGSDTVTGALRAIRACAACFVLSCLLIMITDQTVGWISIALLWAGHVTITGAELFQSASGWGLVSVLSDPRRLGEYQGVWEIGNQVETIIGPAAFTFLAITWGPPGWLVIAAVAVAAAAIAHPAARAAERAAHLGGTIAA
jgi:MFS family permease